MNGKHEVRKSYVILGMVAYIIFDFIIVYLVFEDPGIAFISGALMSLIFTMVIVWG